MEIIPQSSAQFDSALDFYSSRMDQDWGLTDCASFLIMQERNIHQALAADHHFAQAGFVAPLEQDGAG